MSCCILWFADQLLDELIEEGNELHEQPSLRRWFGLRIDIQSESWNEQISMTWNAWVVWISWSWNAWIVWMPESSESLDSEFSLTWRGGGVNAHQILIDASLSLWVRYLLLILKRIKIQHTNLTSDRIALMLTTYMVMYFRQNCMSTIVDISLDKLDCLDLLNAWTILMDLRQFWIFEKVEFWKTLIQNCSLDKLREHVWWIVMSFHFL